MFSRTTTPRFYNVPTPKTKQRASSTTDVERSRRRQSTTHIKQRTLSQSSQLRSINSSLNSNLPLKIKNSSNKLKLPTASELNAGLNTEQQLSGVLKNTNTFNTSLPCRQEETSKEKENSTLDQEQPTVNDTQILIEVKRDKKLDNIPNIKEPLLHYSVRNIKTLDNLSTTGTGNTEEHCFENCDVSVAVNSHDMKSSLPNENYESFTKKSYVNDLQMEVEELEFSNVRNVEAMITSFRNKVIEKYQSCAFKVLAARDDVLAVAQYRLPQEKVKMLRTENVEITQSINRTKGEINTCFDQHRMYLLKVYGSFISLLDNNKLIAEKYSDTEKELTKERDRRQISIDEKNGVSSLYKQAKKRISELEYQIKLQPSKNASAIKQLEANTAMETKIVELTNQLTRMSSRHDKEKKQRIELEEKLKRSAEFFDDECFVNSDINDSETENSNEISKLQQMIRNYQHLVSKLRLEIKDLVLIKSEESDLDQNSAIIEMLQNRKTELEKGVAGQKLQYRQLFQKYKSLGTQTSFEHLRDIIREQQETICNLLSRNYEVESVLSQKEFAQGETVDLEKNSPLNLKKVFINIQAVLRTKCEEVMALQNVIMDMEAQEQRAQQQRVRLEATISLLKEKIHSGTN